MTRRRKVEDHDIVRIISDYRSGRATMAELASRHDVTVSCISLIVNGKRHAGMGLQLLKARREAREAARA